MREARDNLKPDPPSTSLLMLEVYKGMNKFEVEGLNPGWQKRLKEDVEKFDDFKQKAMKTLEEEAPSSTSES